VTLKPGVLDVEGKAIEGRAPRPWLPSVSDVRVGKTIAFDLASEDRAAAEAQVREMAERLLANPVIQSWRVEFGA
jgi:phosphoribosylformylglycinamidine synthase